MSGLDERPDFRIPNNVFCKIFVSIRLDWGYGVDERGTWLLEILPFTSVVDKVGVKEHLETMIEAWTVAPDDFDGRSWTRDGPYSYNYLEKWITNWKRIYLFDTANEIFDDMNHEDAEVLYSLWKAKTLIWKESLYD